MTTTSREEPVRYRITCRGFHVTINCMTTLARSLRSCFYTYIHYIYLLLLESMRVHVRATKVDLSALDHAILTRHPLLYTRPDLQPPCLKFIRLLERSPDALRRPGGALTTVREVRIPKGRNWVESLDYSRSYTALLQKSFFFSKAA